MEFPRIVIVDFGSQTTLLIAKLIRNQQVYTEVVEPKDLLLYLKSYKDLVYGIIFSGGPKSSNECHDWREIMGSPEVQDYPLLGICLGAQIMADMHGAKIVESGGEYGLRKLKHKCPENPLFRDIPGHYKAWQSHTDSIFETDESDLNIISRFGDCIEAFSVGKRNHYGVQFHPEVTHTKNGALLLDNFLNICLVPRLWSANNFLAKIIPELREQLAPCLEPDGPYCIVACSGGVDSTVTARLLQRVLGDHLVAVFVDNGLMRRGEYDQVLEQYKKMGLNVRGIRASSEFYGALNGICEPEGKRKVIGNLFIDIFKREVAEVLPKRGDGDQTHWLGQGTIYPDVIESQGKIKSHHNVGGLPEDLGFNLVEPLRYLFKDDVRELGKVLDIPEVVIGRHPFPGPGLGIRILGDVTEAKVSLLQQADAIFMNLLRSENLYNSVWQAGAILLDSKAVGVQGDKRTYQAVVALRAVWSQNGMTASVSPLPMEFLTRVSTEIVNKVSGVNRVVYDITTKPPGTIEWE